MKNIFLCLSFILSTIFLYLHSEVPVCPYHTNEINHIRNISVDALLDAHRLTGDVIGSVVVSANTQAWDAVKHKATYTEFLETFNGGIAYCNKKGKFLASNRLHQGLHDVRDLFLILYSNCIDHHYSNRSIYERGKIHFDKGNIVECISDINALITSGSADDLIRDFKSFDLLDLFRK